MFGYRTRRIAYYEWLNLLRQRGVLLGLGLLLLAGCYSLYYGRTELERQRTILASFPAQQEKVDEAYLKARFGQKESAGRLGFYLTMPTIHEPAPQAALSLGVRDLHPFCLGLRLLSVQSQKYDSSLDNPLKQLAGNFDLASVLVYVFPLVIIGLGYNLLSSEEEQGTLRLLQTTCMPVAHVLLVRGAVRATVIAAAANLLLAAGWLINVGTEVAHWLAWVVLVNAYLLFWFALVAMVVCCRRSSSWNATALLAGWLLLSVVLPSLGNLVIFQLIPVGQGFTLTLQARQLVHEGWDEDKLTKARQFLADHPEWKELCKPDPQKFTWSWYFANQLAADDLVRPQAREYLDGLRQRQRGAEWLSWLCPPLNLQLALDRMAATDLQAEVAYLENLDQAHQSLQRFLLPAIFAEKDLTPEEYRALRAQLPAWHFRQRVGDWPLASQLFSLVFLSLVLLAICPVFYRRSRP